MGLSGAATSHFAHTRIYPQHQVAARAAAAFVRRVMTKERESRGRIALSRGWEALHLAPTSLRGIAFTSRFNLDGARERKRARARCGRCNGETRYKIARQLVEQFVESNYVNPLSTGALGSVDPSDSTWELRDYASRWGNPEETDKRDDRGRSLTRSREPERGLEKEGQ
ncbi:hypothetical protein DMN91_011699 [Ooceraea biroi]|uniref:Uncharacterized protein n=1 Tax=Ooceraea biroi TaxID=2015173 RepID=A0A3L8D6V7_OOCBI|nr:hypothetical protein DMN91_011699 [Ooceraea biroi]